MVRFFKIHLLSLKAIDRARQLIKLDKESHMRKHFQVLLLKYQKTRF